MLCSIPLLFVIVLHLVEFITFCFRWNQTRKVSLQWKFFKWAIPGLFFIYFCLFKQTLHLLQQIYVGKCASSIPHWDSNPQPSEPEFPPITTRPGLQFSNESYLWSNVFNLLLNKLPFCLFDRNKIRSPDDPLSPMNTKFIYFHITNGKLFPLLLSRFDKGLGRTIICTSSGWKALWA